MAYKVKDHTATPEEIARLVALARENGDIDYAERRMDDIHRDSMRYIENHVGDEDIKNSLKAYLDFVIQRDK